MAESSAEVVGESGLTARQDRVNDGRWFFGTDVEEDITAVAASAAQFRCFKCVQRRSEAQDGS